MSQEFIPITAKFVSTCLDCGERIEVGTKILWSKQLGVKHETCQKNDDCPKNPCVIQEANDGWKDAEWYDYVTATKQTYCQKCGVDVTKEEPHTLGNEVGFGFRRVCKKCF